MTWRENIIEQMEEHGESWDDVVRCNLPDSILDKDQDNTYLDAFSIWTKRRVYFPGTYDGSYFAASAPRNPCKEQTEAVGG